MKKNKNNNNNMARRLYTVLILAGVFVCLIIICCCIVHANSPIKEGRLYYTQSCHSYCYDFSSRKKQEVQIEGYDSISYYTPTDDGYFAFGFNSKSSDEYVSADVLCCEKGTLSVFSRESYPKDLMLTDKYILFISSMSDLVAINRATRERTTISNSVYYGYYVSGDYLCYSERSIENPNVDSEICFVDLNKDVLNANLLDTGIMLAEKDKTIIYSKKSEIYEYCFDTNKFQKTDELPLSQSDSFRNIGSFETDSSNNVYFHQYQINGLSESERMTGLYSQDFTFRLLSYIKICSDRGSNYIPVSNDYDNVVITSYEDKNNVIVLQRPCIFYIYS